MSDEREALRTQFKPNPVRVLLIGESAPAQDHFFYSGDTLTGFTALAFKKVCDRTPEDHNGFLAHFKAHGCYLDDLCLSPVNRLTKEKRRESWRLALPSLLDRIGAMQPKPLAVIVIMRQIAGLIQDGLSSRAATTNVKSWNAPFPAFSERNKRAYVSELADILALLRNRGVLCAPT